MSDFFAAIAGAILVGICAFFLTVHNAYAVEPFIQIGIGESIAIPVKTNGTWYDENLPHQFHTQGLAFKAGLGLKFDKHWSTTLSYISLGKNGVDALAVSDACLVASCTTETPSAFHTVDKVRGLELTGTYLFQTGKVQPYLKAGGFLASHKLHVDVTPAEGTVQHADFSGRITGVVIGAGIKWKWLFTEINYYHGAGGSAAPVSRSFIVPMIGGSYAF